MSYFIFTNNTEDIENTIYRIAENQSDLNNLNIDKSVYKIIEDSQENFNAVKLNIKFPLKYTGNTVTFINVINNYSIKTPLENEVNNFKNQIKQFTNNNPDHPLFNLWNNYYNQLNNLNLNNINYPLTISLQQYFNDLGQLSLNPLQLP
jgi:hypothetical protein